MDGALTRWERPMAALSLIHVHPESSRSWRFLQNPLRAWRSPQIVQFRHDLEHGRERDAAGVAA